MGVGAFKPRAARTFVWLKGRINRRRCHAPVSPCKFTRRFALELIRMLKGPLRVTRRLEFFNSTLMPRSPDSDLMTCEALLCRKVLLTSLDTSRVLPMNPLNSKQGPARFYVIVRR